MNFPVNKESDFNGTFTYLYSLKAETGKKYVYIKGTSTDPEKWGDPEVLIDPSRNSSAIEDGWCSDNIPNQYLLISFPYHSFILTNYTFGVRSHNSNDLLTGWMIFASINNETWIIIDEKEKITDLSKKGASKTFSVNKGNKNIYYKYFKIYMTSNNLNRDFFSLMQIEFFGKLKYQPIIKPQFYSMKIHCHQQFQEFIYFLSILILY